MKILAIIAVILLIIILVIVTYLLVSPIIVLLDSDKGIMFIGWNRYMKAEFSGINDEWEIKVKVPFWQKRFSLFNILTSNGSNKSRKWKKTLGKSRFVKWNRRKFQRIIRQIKIEEFKLLLDTDDYILNAYLTPIFELINYRSRYYTRVNFIGKNGIKLKAKGRIISLLYASVF
jgi:hypothetical protein